MTMDDQVVMHPTIAMSAGKSIVDQCAWCGALVCHHSTGRRLGPCPACGCEQRWRQRLRVGPFHAGDGQERHQEVAA